MNNKEEANENENITERNRLLSSLKNNSLDAATVSELDSLLKYRIGVHRIQQGRRSILKLELDPASKTSLKLLGCIEIGSRYPEQGRATPDPKIQGFPTVRQKLDGTRVSSAILADATPVASTTSTATDKPVSQPYSPSVTVYTAASSQSYNTSGSTLSSQIGEPKVFRNMRSLALMNNSDGAYFKKYSIVLGSFRSENNADFVRRTFNALGERVIIVKNNNDGLHLALLASYDSEAETIQKFDAFAKKYTEGMSRARRISKYGIPLDDMWILVKE